MKDSEKMTLRELTEWARDYTRTHGRTAEEEKAFCISFAMGNLTLDGCKVTWKDLEEAYNKLHPEKEE